MSEYIERSALLKYWLGRDGRRFPLHDCDNFPTAVHLADVQQSIRNAPAADVARVVHGEPVYKNRPEHYDTYTPTRISDDGEVLYKREHHIAEDNPVAYCPECGKRLCARFTNYCPNCGAEMDKEDT